VPAVSPVLANDTALAAVVPTNVKPVAVVKDRSIWKPVSFAEASTHVKLIWVVELVVATNVVGAAGICE